MDDRMKFFDETERQMFELGMAHGMEHLDLISLAMSITLPGPSEILYDYGDELVLLFKGLHSPKLVRTALRHCEIGPNVEVRHVWLRTSVCGSQTSEFDYSIMDGRPDGKGGSYKATIAYNKGLDPHYKVDATPKPIELIVAKDVEETWKEFIA
jgi:hypothetical protein